MVRRRFALRDARRAPGVLVDMARELPGVLRVKRLMRDVPDLYALLAAVDRPVRANPDRSPGRRERALRGVRWALRLVGPRTRDCVPRSLALFAALRSEGVEARYVSGLRRTGAKLEGHAWVEVNGRPLPGSGDEEARRQHVVNLEYPPTA